MILKTLLFLTLMYSQLVFCQYGAPQLKLWCKLDTPSSRHAGELRLAKAGRTSRTENHISTGKPVVFWCADKQQEIDKELKKKDPLKYAILNTALQKSYSAKFNIKMVLPDSDILVDGTALKVSPNMLYMQYKASGGKDMWIIKKGEEVKTFHALVKEWLDSEEMGAPEAARGIQNSDEVMVFILKRTDKSKKAEEKEIINFTLELPPNSIMELLKGHTIDDAEIDWKESTLSVKIAIDKKDYLVKNFEATSTLKIAKGELKGKKMDYNVKVEIKEYNKETVFKFTDAKNKEIPVPKNLFE